MTRDDWKSRKDSDIVGSKALKNVIDDYESKLCQMHSEILVLRSDLERSIADNKRLTLIIADKEKSISNAYEQRRIFEKSYKTEIEKQKRIIKIIRAKWYKRGAMLVMLKDDILLRTRGW